MIRLLKHFGWTWIGLLVSDNDSGETFLRTFTPLLTQNNICTEFLEKTPAQAILSKRQKELKRVLGPILRALCFSKAKVVIVYEDADFVAFLQRFLEGTLRHCGEKVWIRTLQWDLNSVGSGQIVPLKSLNGTLSLTLHTNVVPGFRDFLWKINPYKPMFSFLVGFWQSIFLCGFLSNSGQRPKCTGEENLERVPGFVFETQMSGQSYGLYNAVQGAVHTLQAMYSFRTKQKAMGNGATGKLRNVQPWQVGSSVSYCQTNCLTCMQMETTGWLQISLL